MNVPVDRCAFDPTPNSDRESDPTSIKTPDRRRLDG
jgi:hypothetical protein